MVRCDKCEALGVWCTGTNGARTVHYRSSIGVSDNYSEHNVDLSLDGCSIRSDNGATTAGDIYPQLTNRDKPAGFALRVVGRGIDNYWALI